MMDLGRSEDQRALGELVHAFAEKELRPAARDAEKVRALPVSLANALHALGVACPVPEKYGGQGVPDLVTHLMVAEELAWGDPGIAYAALGAGHAAVFIAQCGTREQQDAWLPRFTGAEPVAGSVLLYEGFGRQPSELRTRAEKVGPCWVITGEKAEVLHPGAPEVAVIVAKRADTSALAAFVAAGPLANTNLSRDDRALGRIGLGVAPTGGLALSGLKLPDSALLAGGDELALARAIAWLRLTLPAIALGCARAALEFARHYATERIAFGRPIASFQGVAFPLADQDMALDAARMELWESARAVEASDDAAQIERLTRSCVARASEVSLQATREGVQTLGGHGFITDYPVERWYRCAAALAAIDFDPTASMVDYVT
jgi:alkylation response protein AidB-like acyl-CoA dehydrogenase